MPREKVPIPGFGKNWYACYNSSSGQRLYYFVRGGYYLHTQTEYPTKKNDKEQLRLSEKAKSEKNRTDRREKRKRRNTNQQEREEVEAGAAAASMQMEQEENALIEQSISQTDQDRAVEAAKETEVEQAVEGIYQQHCADKQELPRDHTASTPPSVGRELILTTETA
mmetsp:Transcript_28547/g.82604  ORF Transcript_28547/g.82604 Transcript_28547/m.82604 type:complete len:167 (-) Transcript_28547:687-1187(-)